VIGRKSKVGDREYEQMLIYLPRELVMDSQFFLTANSPCEIMIDAKEKQMIIRPIDEVEARRKGWVRKDRKVITVRLKRSKSPHT
jgi:hypothetical protein